MKRKRRTQALILSVFVFAAAVLSGCSEGKGEDIVINADGYEGFLLNTESSVAAPVSIPEITASEASEASEDTGEDETEETDLSETTETEIGSIATAQIRTDPPETVTQPIETPAPVTTAETQTAAETTTAETTTEQTTAAETTSQISVTTNANGYSALNYSETRGVWISYIELSSVLTGRSESDFTSNIRKMFQNCADMGINTVYVHVRSHGDAYYRSDYYPWSKYVTGTVGNAPSYDPLEIMVREAHSLGLSFQAWINPYRLCSSSDMAKVSSSCPTGNWYKSSNGDRVVEVNGYYYLNPAYSEAIDLIAAGAAEIVSKYNVDGIHIDDYFYPTTDEYFDSKAFSASGYSSLKSFRTDNCSKMVKKLYSAVKSVNPSVLFGVSPQGNIQNNYVYMYADVETWCSSGGYLDYIAPQIYFGFKNSYQPYAQVLSEWQSMVSGTSVKLIPGLAVYKIGTVDSGKDSAAKNEWITDDEIIMRQIKTAMSQANYGGVILYSYNYVFEPSEHVSAIKAEMDAVKTLFV